MLDLRAAEARATPQFVEVAVQYAASDVNERTIDRFLPVTRFSAAVHAPTYPIRDPLTAPIH